jgi:MFS family permease
MTLPQRGRPDRLVNFAACLLDAVGFPIGILFFSPNTILPVLMRRLGASAVTIGAIPALINALWFLLGLLVVRRVNRLRQAHGFLFWIAVLERVALLPLVPLTIAWGPTHPHRLVAALFVCVTIHATMLGVNQPAYWAVISRTIPVQWRGRLFGFAGAVAGVLCLWVGPVVNRLFSGASGGFPRGYSHGFLIGFVVLTVSILGFTVIREPPREPVDEPDHHVLREAVGVFRSNRDFRRFLYGQIALQLANLAAPFYILAATTPAAPGAQAMAGVAGYAVILPFAGAFGSLPCGLLGDRFGNKPVLIGSACLGIAAAAAALAARTPLQFDGIFLALGLFGAGQGLAGNNIVMEFAKEPSDVPLYTVIANAVTAVPRIVAPLAGGLLAEATGGYRAGFVAAAAFCAIGLALTARAREPRHATVGGPHIPTL